MSLLSLMQGQGSAADFRHKIVYDCVSAGFPASSRPFVLSPEMRRLGLHIVAGRGSGKSRFLGRYFAFSDFIFDVPTIIFDTGDTIDNLIDKIRVYAEGGSAEWWGEVMGRVRYVNMAGQDDSVVPFPFYYRFGKESTAEVAQRFVELIRRITPELQSASIQGFPPLERMANHAGRILVTLGLPITDMAKLLTNVEGWQGKIQEALRLDPSLYDSMEYFKPKNPAGFHLPRAEPLLTELDRLTATPALRAMFSATTLGIDWQEVIAKKQIVLLDFRDVRRNPELYRLLLTATFRYLMDFIQHRGTNRAEPVSVIVDEFSSLVSTPTPGAERLVINDMQLWLNELMRRHNLWLTLSHQELSPLSDKVQSLLLGMGNQLIGKIGDIEDALRLAKAFMPIDPLKVKRTKNVWSSGTIPYEYGWKERRFDSVIDEEPVEYSIPEQHYTHAYKLQNLSPLYFLQRIPGTEMMGLADFSIAEFEKGRFVKPALIADIRSVIFKGQPIVQAVDHIADADKKVEEEAAPKPLPVKKRVPL